MELKDLLDSSHNPKQESPLKSLETDLILYSDSLKEIAIEIIAEGVSNYPIFIAHQHEVSLGEMVLNKEEVSTEWSINVATLDDFLEAGAIEKNKVEFFKKNYKDPEKFMCLFVVVPEGANFVFYPYK